MEALKVERDSLLVRIKLWNVLCPCCGREIVPEREWETCKCGYISYKKARFKFSMNSKFEYCMPLFKNKLVECDIGKGYVCFRFSGNKSRTVNVFVLSSIPKKDVSRLFKEFLSLELEDIVALQKEYREGTEKIRRTSIDFSALLFELKCKYTILRMHRVNIKAAFLAFQKIKRKEVKQNAEAV